MRFSVRAVSMIGLIAIAGPLVAQRKVYALKAARMFESASGNIVQPGMIVVADGKIQTVGGSSVPSGATVIDLGDATLLPGFIDSHTHLTMDFNADFNAALLLGFQRTVAESAIRATENARKTLM